MKSNIKYYFASVFVFLLLSPIFIKIFDGNFHDHHHESGCCDTSTPHRTQINEVENICTILDFELSFQIIIKLIFLSPKVETFDSFIYLQQTFHFVNRSKYTFLLRAPPAFTFI